MAKFLLKSKVKNSEDRKVVDMYSYSRKSKFYLKLSIIINILLSLALVIALNGK